MKQRSLVRVTLEDVNFPAAALTDEVLEAYDRFVADLHSLGVRVEDYDYWPNAWNTESGREST